MQKGQLFSADFLVSMIAITAAIGLLIHSVEVNAYNQKEEQLYNELKYVAETAADLLVASNATACEVNETGEHIVNCVDSQAPHLGDLFPSSGYGYQICSHETRVGQIIPADAIVQLNCGTYTEGDYYEVRRRVVVNKNKIKKEDMEKGNFTLGIGETIEISIRVWRT